MKLLSVSLLLSFVVTACSSHTQLAVPASCSPPWSSLAQKEKERTLALVRPDGDNGLRTYCSGVWLSKTTMVTAGHCVEAAGEQVSILSFGYEEAIPAVVSAYVPEADLALLESPPMIDHDVAALGSPPDVGEPVSAVGHPLGMRWSFSCGHVSALRKLASTIEGETVDITWIQATTPISPGSSGGGLWDSSGRLVAIASRTFVRGQLMGLFVPVSYIPSANPAGPEPDPTLLAPPEKAPEAPADQPTP